MSPAERTANYFGRLALLVALYVATGGMGLLLAVPPGYATVIWPPSGIAAGMLIVHGWRMWPGVLMGSFLLNAWNSGAFAGEVEFLSPKMLAAAGIALGSTAQALVGRWLVARFIKLPLRLQNLRQVLVLLGLTGPLACLIAASVGVATLHANGVLAAGDIFENWIAWWTGDVFGVAVFMPLVLLAPGNPDRITWRDANIGRLPVASILLLLLPLGLTFYVWKLASVSAFQRSEAKFQTLAIESEKALEHRLSSYENALRGAAGFVQGSQNVSRDEWRTYVETMRVREYFPGVRGVGWIRSVPAEELDAYESTIQADAGPTWRLQHVTANGPNYIITYLEPEADNRPALGLNIGFEPNRLEAANRARDTGRAAMTGRIALVQDNEQQPGVLLLQPIYFAGMPVTTVEERKAALRGWTYIPFTARKFLEGLTVSQGADFRLRVYDGGEEAANTLIYADGAVTSDKPVFVVRTIVQEAQRDWLVVWESTQAFELGEKTASAAFILVGGLLFTGLFAVLLVVLSVRRTEAMEQLVGEGRFALPLLVFLGVSAGGAALYGKLADKEEDYVRRQVEEQAESLEQLLQNQADERFATIGRMAARWESAGGTAQRVWRIDAAHLTQELAGLKALEWIDADYTVQWVEPLAGHERIVGTSVWSQPAQGEVLRAAANAARPMISPPMKHAHGFAGFALYHPLVVNKQPAGFLAGMFSIKEMFERTVNVERARDYAVSILFEGEPFYSSGGLDALPEGNWTLEKPLHFKDQVWTLRVTPKLSFVTSQTSSLPSMVLVAALLVAALAALAVRYVFISRLKSAHLAKSSQLNAGIISSSAHLVIATDEAGIIVIFNKAAQRALGYSASEVVGKQRPALWLDPAELELRARELSEEFKEEVKPDMEVFRRIPLRDGFESREWTYVRRNGSRFTGYTTVTPLIDMEGRATGFLGVVEDITARKEMERLKSEFTAVVSHELRTPLTSIRGSLGLIMGALAKDLPKKVRELLEIAQSNCERLVLLTNDILDVEKFSAGQMRFDIQPHSLAGVVRQAVQANDGYAKKFHVRLQLGAVEESWQVAVDADRFVQVMSNLLSNAIKYSPTGGLVEVSAAYVGERVRINVKDGGPGIPADFRDRIFEKFSQADSSSSRSKSGTGLGLHIAKRFVEHMKGAIGFDSSLGEGATFWIEIPLVRADVIDMEPGNVVRSRSLPTGR
jgi:PAS domain S-box-containing protein